MADTPRIHFRAIIVCDDIRREMTGKDIYIGVYQTDMAVPQFPTRTTIALALMFEPITIGSVPILIEMGGNIAKTTARLNVDIQIGNDNSGSPESHLNVAIVVGSLPLQIDNEGLLTIRAKHTDATEWELVRTINVKAGGQPAEITPIPHLAPIAPSQPS